MQKIKFIKNNNIYNVKASVYANEKIKRLKIVFQPDNVPSLDVLKSGFVELNEYSGVIQGHFEDYTNIYRSEDDGISFVLSNIKSDVWVEPEVIEPKPIEPYIPTEEELQTEFENVKQNKIIELSNACKQSIYSGVSVGDFNYSYTMQDQSNLINAVTMAQNTGMSIPYHADNEPCSLYSLTELMEIYVAEQINVTKNQTYFNQMKLYINSLTDRNDLELVKSIYYGFELTGEYINKYNSIMEHSNKIATSFSSIKE